MKQSGNYKPATIAQIVFEAAATDLDKLTDTVTLYIYISFCEDIWIPTRTFLSFKNKLKQLCHAKEDAYRTGDKILFNHARNRLTNDIRGAKRSHSEKTTRQAWTGLRPCLHLVLRSVFVDWFPSSGGRHISVYIWCFNTSLLSTFNHLCPDFFEGRVNV